MSRSWPWIAVGLYALIALVPIAYLGYLSLHDAQGRLTTAFYTAYESSALWSLLWKSVQIAGGATLAALALGAPIGVLLGRSSLWFKPVWIALTVVPLLLPPYLMTICWFYLLSPDGWINTTLLAPVGIGPIEFQRFDGLPGCIASLALTYYPIVALLTWVGVRTPDPAFEEAARLVRAPWGAFRRTTWVVARPYVLTGAVFVFFFSLINYAVPYQFSIGGILPSEIHSQYQAHHNHGQAAALTVPFVFASLVLLWAERRTVARGAIVRGRTTADAPPIRLGFAQPLALLFAAAVSTLAAAAPIAVLVKMAWPFDGFRAALESFRPELINTVLLAAGAATLAVVIAIGVATRIARGGLLGGTLDVAGMLPLAIPPMSLGIALILVWNRQSAFGTDAAWIARVSDAIYTTGWIMLFALIARTFPFALRPVFYGLGGVDPALREAATLAGASRTRTFLRITLPLVWRSLALAWFLVFLFSVGEYDATHLVQPPGWAVVAPRLIGSFHNFRHDLVSNNALVMIALVVFPILIYLLVPKRSRRPV